VTVLKLVVTPELLANEAPSMLVVWADGDECLEFLQRVFSFAVHLQLIVDLTQT
jgi:hypothetical protein